MPIGFPITGQYGLRDRNIQAEDEYQENEYIDDYSEENYVEDEYVSEGYLDDDYASDDAYETIRYNGIAVGFNFYIVTETYRLLYKLSA